MATCRVLGNLRSEEIDNPRLEVGQIIQVTRVATGYPYSAGDLLIVASIAGDTVVVMLSNGVAYIPTGITSNKIEIRVLKPGQRVELTV